jgi:5-(carboxyamino)imidazole ribonucleotide synthase
MNYPVVGRTFRLGILGGGQLGRMLVQAAIPYDVELVVMDPQKRCPAAEVCHDFVQGSFALKEDVLSFAKGLDAITVEIENVSIEALEELEAQGVTVHPSSAVLKTIRDKGLQKQFFQKHKIATLPFHLVANREELLSRVERGEIAVPFVQKTRTGGYDGQGVQVIFEKSHIGKAFDTPSVIEPLCDIAQEISVIVARGVDGATATYDPIEMVFDPEANLIDYLIYPAPISDHLSKQCIALAESAAEALGIVGILAVELFVEKDGTLWINEVAPRPHNSGHQTIEASMTSQYEQHLRCVLELPLGDVDIKQPSMMLNLVADGSGVFKIEGLREVLALPGVKVHLYGKHECRPNRKMGHVTIMHKDHIKALETVERIRSTLRITV